ncbi:hypothetical protein ID852_20030 [Xenorhabdus sp. 42]|uniref:hypothetical protein n=1 Tax=Xenorhabdus szentirmaii TaxID=290112 RepID=UPI0019BF4A25|nr:MULTISPECIES: hypothetical protein [unclassified Xenorhabdus]MBD2782715.1 hypothetical protein [Xenorhabdus sp. 38]MBD2822907.1 hypothetical protein [Xenorhabdus sp. 42]
MDNELIEHQLAFLLAISMAEAGENAGDLRARITKYMSKLFESDKSFHREKHASALLSIYGKADKMYFDMTREED